MELIDEGELTKKDKIILFIIKLPIILLLIGMTIYSYLYVRDIMTFYFLLGMWVFILVIFVTFGISEYGAISGYSCLGAIFYVIGLFAFQITIVAKYILILRTPSRLVL